MSLRYFYHEYKSVLLFTILLGGAVALSYALSPLIPADIYRRIISPAMHCFLISFCGSSAWFLLRHHEGMPARKSAGLTCIAWAVLVALGMSYRLYNHTPDVIDGVLSLYGWELVVGNLFAWLLMVYPTEVLRPGWLTWRKAVLQLLPVFIMGMIQYYCNVDLRWLLTIYPFSLLIVLVLHIRAYRLWCENNYASMDAIDVQWVWQYMAMILIAGASYTYMIFLNTPTKLFTQMWLLFFILFYSTEQIMLRPDPWRLIRRMKRLPGEREEEAEPEQQEDTSGIANAEYKEALELWMTTEKPYLNSDFRLTDLMQVLPMNRTYLSAFINSAYGCNFYQFVTNYRIAEAKQVMRDNPQMTISEVAERCGYSSQTVFGRIFARETGKTPSEWSASFDN